jgi:hypothetical protein
MVAFSSSTFAASLLSLSLLVNAAVYDTPRGHDIAIARARRSPHHGLPLARRAAEQKPTKRCKVKTPVKSNNKPDSKPSSKPSSHPDDNDDDGSSGSGGSSGSSGSSGSGHGGGNTGGTISSSGACGKSGATSKPTKTSGPNGSIEFLNCGIDGGGWNPPHISIDQLIVKPLSDAGSVFNNCKKYMSIFNDAADKYGVPALLLASFGMQESSCQRDSVGQGGEQGIMQISKDKCRGAPGGDCRDPNFNIHAGAKFFADQLKANDGNVVVVVGLYNGWSRGLTYEKATRARHSKCCHCQNNLDYLQQFFNGWLQGVDPGSLHMGKYHNIDDC